MYRFLIRCCVAILATEIAPFFNPTPRDPVLSLGVVAFWRAAGFGLKGRAEHSLDCL